MTAGSVEKSPDNALRNRTIGSMRIRLAKMENATWDDYAIMSMVESGLGISILPRLILKRVPYKIVAKEMDIPAYRRIGVVLRSRKTASLAVKRFLDYLVYR